MKRNYIKLIFFILFCVGSISCKEDKTADNVEEAASGLEKLAAISTQTGVLLTWENPPGHTYDQVEIWYEEAGRKVVHSQQANEHYTAVAFDLQNDEVYKFHLQTRNSGSEQRGRELTVKSRKISLTDPVQELEDILNSVRILGGDGGVRVHWNNPEHIPATIVLAFEGERLELKANQLVKEVTVKNLDLDKVYVFEVSLLFDGEFITAQKNFSVRPLAGYKRLVNEGWNITASSEEISANEHAPAANLLDNNPATYWRSKVSTPEHRYPHYVIIDLQRTRRVTAITLSRKQGDSDYSSWDNNISLSVDGRTFSETYRYFGSNTNPNQIFKVEFNRTVEGEQMYMLPFVHTARYIRIDMVRASRVHAVFGDINVYGE
ncbi:discoidin domain-containing protein [Sphingobacterium pedocola]|uniref:F5/8 type C domain-containing protein n=1 Tax=Sphingobacterium pedocola TaxID=2082722 RepID=A0ABR9T798_9SPHI|nr:discoidin domain-containing protein [Sphingobacterium pedocola]MBE8721196.1 hypothetical protein [Sphingobacterium pedocola]